MPRRQSPHRPSAGVARALALGVAFVWLALAGPACDDESLPSLPAIDARTPDAPMGSTGDAGGADTAVDAGSADADASAAGQFYPCDVLAVLRAKCHTCHTMPPRNGAPMSLLTWAATQNLTSDSATVKVWQRARQYVASNYMPYMGSPTGPLTPAEKAILLAWLDAGALPAAQACADDAGVPDTDASLADASATDASATDTP